MKYLKKDIVYKVVLLPVIAVVLSPKKNQSNQQSIELLKNSFTLDSHSLVSCITNVYDQVNGLV